MNLSGYLGHATIFSWMFTIASCLVVGLGLDFVSGWLAVMHTYLYCFRLSLTHCLVKERLLKISFSVTSCNDSAYDVFSDERGEQAASRNEQSRVGDRTCVAEPDNATSQSSSGVPCSVAVRMCSTPQIVFTRVYLYAHKIDWLIDSDLAAHSAQIGYILPSKSMLQLKNEVKFKMLRDGNTQNETTHYNKQLFNLLSVGKHFNARDRPYHESNLFLVNMLTLSSSSSIYLPYFHIKLHTYIMQWQATRKTQSSTSWRPKINRTVINILLHKNIQWNKKRGKTNRLRTRQREQQEA